ncbi:hypothetical protein BR93DRAFT_926166 [Coniochaeta sp. PMI_546]|nr:hypothetical protein BR93DRAFT_926166 [Coniochaeta sp. PMI_546]
MTAGSVCSSSLATLAYRDTSVCQGSIDARLEVAIRQLGKLPQPELMVLAPTCLPGFRVRGTLMPLRLKSVDMNSELVLLGEKKSSIRPRPLSTRPVLLPRARKALDLFRKGKRLTAPAK